MYSESLETCFPSPELRNMLRTSPQNISLVVATLAVFIVRFQELIDAFVSTQVFLKWASTGRKYEGETQRCVGSVG